jgi:hypothetical protein
MVTVPGFLILEIFTAEANKIQYENVNKMEKT